MTLQERLRNTPNWSRESFEHWKTATLTYDRAPFEAADRIDALERENAALRKDAERYRWLRDNMVQDGANYDGFMSTRDLFPRGNEYPGNLDAAIDAAMAQKVDAG